MEITKNRKVYFDYVIDEEYDVGIVLSGHEIKSIRNHEVNITDSYCYFCGKNNLELFVKDMYIKPYRQMNMFSYGRVDPTRDRKLLLTGQELKRLSQKVKTRGYTIIPINLYINDSGRCKMKIGLCRGKHTYDKKESIKERDIKREMDREIL